MRRSRNMNRGGGMGRNMSGGGGGPLITEHLKDIDLELELLKRKREMIEQQHTMLQPIKKQPQRSYNHQPYTYNENGAQGGSIDFSHLYNDGPQQYRKPFVKKRQSDTVWQHDSFPKRSAGHSQRYDYSGPSPTQNQRPFTANQSKRGLPNTRGHGKQSIGQRISNQKVRAPEKKFVPNKVTKPTKPAPPNKIASQPVAERNNLVAVAMKSVAESIARDQEAFRLHPNKEPTKQMVGRMEMALGAILRDVRELYTGTPNEEILRTVPLQRIIKQAIRDRVRTAMLGKVIGATVVVIKEYRDMFPKETDHEIVDQALTSVGYEIQKKPVNAIVTASNPDQNKEKDKRPDEYFRSNMYKLLNSHLNEMFSKLEDFYNPPSEIQSNVAETDFTEDNFEENKPTTAINVEQEKPKEDDNTAISANAEVVNDEAAKTQEAQVDAPSATNNDSEVTGINMEVDAAATAVANKKAELAANEAVAKEAAANLGISNENDYKRMLPRLLKRHIAVIIKLLNLNKMYKRAVGDLIATTRDKYVAYGKEEPKKPEQTSEEVVSTQQSPKKTLYPLPYYVKIMGKPQLPKKKVMQPFLEVFHPKSIKKHRSIHNLLFIGFTEKSDFDAIVEANGTVIGRSTLSVRVCDKTTEKQEDNANTSTDESNLKPDEQKPVSEDLLGADLDGQINDLLTSIRNTEDNSAENVEEVNVKSEKDNLNKTIENLDSEAPATEKANELVQDSKNNEDAANIEIDNEGQNESVQPENENCDNNTEAENKEVKLDNAEQLNTELNDEKVDQLTELKSDASGRSTPTRASSRLASAAITTPGSIRTRRSSKLAQNQ